MPERAPVAPPPALTVRVKKKSDGAAALTCVRADGSTTWQRQDGQLGRIFPLHDLTHFAVESVLGLREAFFGSIANGWDISDFAGEGNLRRVTAEALLAEAIVGCFDLERMMGELSDAGSMNARLVDFYEQRKLPPTAFRLTDEQVARIHAVRAELLGRWNAVPAGETLELRFE